MKILRKKGKSIKSREEPLTFLFGSFLCVKTKKKNININLN